MGTYRPSSKDAKKLQKKAVRNILPTVFTPEQANIIQGLTNRLDKLEKAVESYKKKLAEVKGQYNKLFAAYRQEQFREASRVLSKDEGRKSSRGANIPLAGDDKGEEQE